MSKMLTKSKVDRQKHGPFVVYDDGEPDDLYSVYACLPSGESSFIGSGMKNKNAHAVAEGLNRYRQAISGSALLLE